MEKKKTVVITQRRKANIYIMMGLLLIVVTIVWANVQAVPEVVLPIIGFIGMVPVAVLLMFDHEDMDKRTLACWRGAFSSTVMMLMILLTCFWVFTTVVSVIKPISIDVCYMIPCLAGATYILVGDNYKTYEDELEELDE